VVGAPARRRLDAVVEAIVYLLGILVLLPIVGVLRWASDQPAETAIVAVVAVLAVMTGAGWQLVRVRRGDQTMGLPSTIAAGVAFVVVSTALTLTPWLLAS
jgi:hypothetical protein